MKTLGLDAYQHRASRTDVSKGHDSASFLLLGLFGEVGSVLAEVKKRERDQTGSSFYEDRLVEEIGDVLWYLAVTAARNDIVLSDLALRTFSIRHLLARNAESGLTFNDLQPALLRGVERPSMYLEWRLIDLAEAAGRLVAAHRTFLKRRDRDPLIKAFQDFFSELVYVANRAGISLDRCAHKNLEKTLDRWPKRRMLPQLKDAAFPSYERLPQSLIVNIIEEQISEDKYFVYQICNGIHIGDRLTDNIADPDDYRFHDVFHYAFAAVLGWSPVIRSLYKTKRKSNRVIDETEDGARATLIEEGISAIIFNQAKHTGLFENVERGKLSFDLLKTVRIFVEGYEVQDSPFWAWEEAILQGFEAFRFLKLHRSATIAINGRSLTVGPLRT